MATTIDLRNAGRVINAQEAIDGSDLPTLDQVSGLISGGGDLNASFTTVRLTATTEATLASTLHAFQIGPTGGANVIMDGNEILARNNGATTILYLNEEGGAVVAGGVLTSKDALLTTTGADSDNPLTTTTVEGGGIDSDGTLIRATATSPADPKLELNEAGGSINGGRIYYDTSADEFIIGTTLGGVFTQAISIDQGSNTVNFPGAILINGAAPLDAQDLTDHENAADPHADYLLESVASTTYLPVAGGTITGPVAFTGSGAFLTPEYLDTTVNVTDADAADALGGFSMRHMPTGSSNQPTGTEHGLFTLARDTNYAFQFAGDYRTGDVFVRGQDLSLIHI